MLKYIVVLYHRIDYERKKMEKINTIKEMYKEERPYEKCEKFGAENLTDAELLAILIRTGTKGENSLELSRRLLYENGCRNGLAGIHKWTLDELIQIKGIGKVKAIQLICLSELSKRLARTDAVGKLDFSSPHTIADYYMEDMRHRTREVLKLIFLNTRCKLIGECIVSEGTIDSALVSPRELFIESFRRNAYGIILLHNHPGGDPTPSREDVAVTRRIYEAGELLGIRLFDHIIIGDHRFVSMKEKRFFGK